MKNQFGAIIGGTLGSIKGVLLSSSITLIAVMDTALLAGVGAIVGFALNELLKWLRDLIKKKPAAKKNIPATGEPSSSGDAGLPTALE